MRPLPIALRRWKHIIEEIEDYRSQGPDGDGYWVHLKPGWVNTLTETHSVHEDELKQCVEILAKGFIVQCSCAECERLKCHT